MTTVITSCGNTQPHGRHNWVPLGTYATDLRLCPGGKAEQPANDRAEQAADRLARECEALAARLHTVAAHARARRYASIELPEVGLRGTEIDTWIAVLKDRLGDRIEITR